MQARDATGRQVSLLNDDSAAAAAAQRPSFTGRYIAVADRSPLLRTPELLRSDSYDSTTSGYDAISPMTPGLYDYAPRPMYDDYMADKASALKRPSYVQSSRSNSYDEDASHAAAPERAGKRYPCRYRDSHGCEKTFTTSGHASRHSKIHTAEKAVQCTFAGCNKKFTRADNMKQHLETHFKDKSRSSASSKTASKISSAKRASISSKSTSSSHSSSSKDSSDVHMWDVEEYGHAQQPLPSFSATWDIRGAHGSLSSRPNTMRTSSGLDALAAIACQEGA